VGDLSANCKIDTLEAEAGALCAEPSLASLSLMSLSEGLGMSIAVADVDLWGTGNRAQMLRHKQDKTL
jgi:hypothetical protein